MNLKIKRALISVSDKTGLDNLAKFLKSQNIEILSTGGTAKKLRELDLNVKDVSEYTGFPEIMDGRVKTLHPSIHGGLLAVLDNKDHINAMKENNIQSIDLVIVNLYPFEEAVAAGADFNHIIENIDIGGPSMVRSAAKNYAFTTVITDHNDYDDLIKQMRENDGVTTTEFRQYLAAKAFAKTAAYDSAISGWFAKQRGEDFPQTVNITAQLKQGLRYGENPHQRAAFYSLDKGVGIASAKQIQGKELSYNNINDADAALALVSEFKQPAAVIIKHANPCGVAIGYNILDAYKKALASDPVSAFGGILAFNRTLEADLAEEIAKMFVEAIIVPKADDAAREILSKKKNLRLLEVASPFCNNTIQVKSVLGGLLVQEADSQITTEEELQLVTKRKPTAEEIEELLFAFKVSKHVKSNAIVLVKNKASIGIGAGQMSRVDSSRIAVMKAGDCTVDPERAKGSVLASDAFFPFADGVTQAANAGVVAIIQPGGSVRDEEVIAEADKYNIAMVFTARRHFKH